MKSYLPRRKRSELKVGKIERYDVFGGKYPVRKSIQTEFAHVGGKDGLQFQVDAVAYLG